MAFLYTYLSRRATSIAVALYIGLATCVLYSININWYFDDPFITYRYARNLAQGIGFVYNAGERVLSTTTPLFTLLLAALSWAWHDLPHLALLIGAVSLSLGGIFIWDLARTWQTPLVGWSGLLIYPFFLLLNATLGSETPLYLAVCLGAFVFYARRQMNGAAVFSALATLTRPDGALIPAVLALHYLVRIRKPVPWRAVGLFLAIILPWVIFAWAYFGSPLPTTLITKQQQGLMHISKLFAVGLLVIAKPYFQHWFLWLAAFLSLIGIFYAAVKARSWMLLFAWTVMYFSAYAILGVTSYFWYYAPLVPAFVVACGLGITAFHEALVYLVHYFKPLWKNAFQRSLLPSFLICATIAAGQFSLFWERQTNQDLRYPVYRQIGEWLDQNIPQNASVGMFEVGIIGYYSNRRVIDFAGLIQPEVSYQFNRNTTYDDSAVWATQHYKPDYLVLLAKSFPKIEQGYATKYCTLVKKFPSQASGYHTDLEIYHCPASSNASP